MVREGGISVIKSFETSHVALQKFSANNYMVRGLELGAKAVVQAISVIFIPAVLSRATLRTGSSKSINHEATEIIAHPCFGIEGTI